MKIAVRKTVFMGKYLYPLPHVDWKAAFVRKYAEPYQPIWSGLLKSSVIWGIAVPMIVCDSC